MSETFEMVAKTLYGLEEILAEELLALGANDLQIGRRMVSFTGDKELLYKANFHCRTALRILKPIYHFKAKDADTVYKEVKKVEWEKYLSLDKTFAIDSVIYSEDFNHSKFVAYRTKDAIVDYFIEKFKKRPSVRVNNPDLYINIHISHNDCTLSIDSSGESLHKRGYRVDQTEAPLNEVGALRYLLKPEETKLFSLLDEISYALGKERRYLIENVGGETVKIPVDTIYSVEAKGHYIRLHTSVGDYEYKKNLSEIAEELAKDQPGQKTEFISTHRSFLVSLAAVERVQRTECILCDGSSVPVSRNAYKSVNEAFIRYYMEHGDMCEK